MNEYETLEPLNEKLKALGLNPELTHTGGGICVIYLTAKNQVVGIDEYSVCVYDLDITECECILDLPENMTQNERFDLLANTAKTTFEKIQN